MYSHKDTIEGIDRKKSVAELNAVKKGLHTKLFIYELCFSRLLFSLQPSAVVPCIRTLFLLQIQQI